MYIRTCTYIVYVATVVQGPGETADSLDQYMSVVDKQLDAPTRTRLRHQVLELQKVCPWGGQLYVYM